VLKNWLRLPFRPARQSIRQTHRNRPLGQVLERLEDRTVPSLTWTALGEGSVAGDTVTMSPARSETATQPIGIHGAYAL
jgi:hypothetical protein